MRQYILDLTNNLIGKNRYKDVFTKFASQDKDVATRSASLVEFVRFVKVNLNCGDVRDMTPGTLGKIMCALDYSDLMAANHWDIISNINFSGRCEQFLREIVSLCLAYAIWERLNSERQQ